MATYTREQLELVHTVGRAKISFSDALLLIDYTANDLNQYSNIGSSAYSYDGNGNLTNGSIGSFSYDAQNRLTGATVAVTTDSIAYDSKNRVVERTVNGTATYYIYDGWDLIEERNSSGTVLATYVHGVSQDEMLTRTTTSGTVYYHQNGLGSVVNLTNASGTVVEQYKYDICGTPAITDGSGDPLTMSAYGNRFMFTGREYLSELGLYDYRNRDYSPTIGRFLQTDPMRFSAGDVNIYRYCGNNSLNSTDPFGESAWGAVGHVVEGVGEMAGGAAVASTSETGVGAVASLYLLTSGLIDFDNGVGELWDDMTGQSGSVQIPSIQAATSEGLTLALGGDSSQANQAAQLADLGMDLYGGLTADNDLDALLSAMDFDETLDQFEQDLDQQLTLDLNPPCSGS